MGGQTSSSDGDVTGNHGNVDAWVVKTNSTGSLQWQKCLGGINYDYANSIQTTPDGGYIMAGYSYSTNGDVTRTRAPQNVPLKCSVLSPDFAEG